MPLTRRPGNILDKKQKYEVEKSIINCFETIQKIMGQRNSLHIPLRCEEMFTAGMYMCQLYNAVHNVYVPIIQVSLQRLRSPMKFIWELSNSAPRTLPWTLVDLQISWMPTLWIEQ